MKSLLPLFLILSFAATVGAVDDSHAADRQQLRDLLAKATEALNKRDLIALEGLLHRPYVFVMSDQTLVTSMEALKKADADWFAGPEAPIISVTFTPVLDGPATFLSDTVAVASGTCTDTVVLRKGGEMRMHSRWTATMVKSADGWRVANVHSGVSPFDNPVVTRLSTALINTVLWAALTALVIGGIIGLLIGRRQRKV